VDQEFANLGFDIRDGVARIILNRPEAGNAFDPTMAAALLQAVLRCDSSPDVRAVVITGAGKAFCVGGDLKALGPEDNLPRLLKEMTTYFHGAVSRLARMDAPVIAAVNGVAAGAGMSLACAADFVFAAENARFTTAYARIGQTPDGGLTYFLPRLVGYRQAVDLLLTSRQISAREALELGIVNRVAAEAELLESAETFARQLAKGATKALGGGKRLLRLGWTETLETQLENETQSIAEMATSADAREAMLAFVEKRPPRFEGR